MRIKISDSGAGETLDERIIRACKLEEDSGNEVENSVFYVSRAGWFWIARYAHSTAYELFYGGHRIMMPTWFGCVYIVADKLLGEYDDNGAAPLYVEWGDSLSYEECIRQGELWMERAIKRKP